MSLAPYKTRLRIVATTLALGLVLPTSSARAQRAPAELFHTGLSASERGCLGLGPEPGPVPRFALIRNETIQDELRMGPGQKARIAEVSAQLRKKAGRLDRELGQEIRLLGDQPDPWVVLAAGRPFAEAQQVLEEEAEARSLRALEPRQRARLDQVQLQAEGPLAFARPRVLERLNLEDAQVEAIQEILARRDVEEEPATSVSPSRARGGKAPGPRKVRDREPAATRTARSEKAQARELEGVTRSILKLLTTKQRATYQGMLGTPFEAARLRIVEPARESSLAAKPAGTPQDTSKPNPGPKPPAGR